MLAADAAGRVTRVNPVAERLTGWSEKEAIGRPLEEVFDIVNEETRAKAQNPITRVLAEGVVVGLANHTALIARDGTERPIADSGAPIRDAQWATRGAVMITASRLPNTEIITMLENICPPARPKRISPACAANVSPEVARSIGTR